MASLVYYGSDTVDNIPSTIPLTDKEETIQETWTFKKNLEVEQNVTAQQFITRNADLAERFEADSDELEEGMVVELGGKKEITIGRNPFNPFGIITKKAGLRMNETAGDDKTHPYVCWCGRVPCLIIGPVKKFDKIYLSEVPGLGEAKERVMEGEKVIGIALEDKPNILKGLVEIIAQIKI